MAANEVVSANVRRAFKRALAKRVNQEHLYEKKFGEAGQVTEDFKAEERGGMQENWTRRDTTTEKKINIKGEYLPD
jgi:hypothetical protein